MMDNIFIVQTVKGWMIIYMDDMLIFAETKEELTERTLEVLELLQENDLYLKPQKCKFCVMKIDFLGFIIEDGQMTMDPVKLAGIADWPVPTQIFSWVWELLSEIHTSLLRPYSTLERIASKESKL